jgi:predicted transcriptional regulator
MKKAHKKTTKEIAKELNIAEGTIFNWKKEKQKLYEIVMNYYSDTSNIEVYEDFINDFKELDEEEKNMYRFEIKARIMRKKLK